MSYIFFFFCIFLISFEFMDRSLVDYHYQNRVFLETGEESGKPIVM